MRYYSGISHPNVNPPYGILTRLSNTLDTFDSCGNRFEDSVWQIKIVHIDWKKLDTELDRLYNLLNTTPPLCQNRLVQDHEWESNEAYEADSGLYVADTIYRVNAQKVYQNSNVIFQDGDFSFQDTLSTEIDNVISTTLGSPNWSRPFAIIPKYSGRKSFETSCERVRQRAFDICIEHNNAAELDLLLDKVDDLVSYATYPGSIATEWQGDTLIAKSPGLWKGSITYNVLIQSAV